MLREGEPHKSQSSPGRGASPARLVSMRTTAGAQTGKPRHEWQAGRTAQTPATETSPLRWRNTPLHAHEHTLGKHKPPHNTCNPCHSHLGTQQEGAGCQEQWEETGEGGGRGAREGYGYARVRRSAHTRACAKTRSHPPNNTQHTPPATQLMHATEFRTPCATCRRTWSKIKCKSGTVTTYPGDRSHGPQPGTKIISSALPTQKIPDPTGP